MALIKKDSVRKILTSTSFLAIVACLLWATPFPAIKIGLNYTTPLNFAGLRFFISGLIIIPFIPKYIDKIKALNRRSWKLIFEVALLQTTILYALFYTGVDLLPGALGAMLIGAQPLFAAVMAHLLMKNDKMTWNKISVIILGFIGVCVISLGRADFVFTSTIPLGVAILILNNIVGSTGNVVVSRDAGHIPPRLLASFSMIIGGAALILISIPIELPSWTIKPTEYYIALGWLAIVSATSITIWFGLLGRPGVKVSNLNIWKFIIPIFGACFSWILLPNESPDAISITGMAIIVASLFLLNYINRRKVNI